MSPGTINAKTILVEDGANVDNYGTAVQLGLVRVLNDGGAYLKDDIMYPLYDANMVRTGYESIFFEHTHSGTGLKQGGTYQEIRNANMAYWINLYYGANINHWLKTGTGTLVNDQDSTNTYMRIIFGSTSGASTRASGTIGGLQLSFSNMKDLQVYMEAKNASANASYRIGHNCDRVEDTQSTTRKQFAWEGCPAHGANWVVISSNGNAGNLTAVSTTLPVTSNQENYQLTYHVGLDVKAYYNGVLQATCNSANVPSSGGSDRNRMIIAGVGNDGTGGVKTLEVYFVMLSMDPITDEFYNIV